MHVFKGYLAAATTGLALILATPLAAQEGIEAPVAEAIRDYMDFATYGAGIITPQQIDEEVFKAAVFIDTRDAHQFEARTIPGATNIEWREIPARLDELPTDRMVILFCNTGSLSGQALFAARLLGRENVLMLETGIDGWSQTAAYKPS